MKKRIFPILMLIFALLSIISCDPNAKEMEEGSVNYYIYPYVKFVLSPDGSYYSAYVVKGAGLKRVSVPGFVHSDSRPIPVKEFAGFEDIDDSLNLEELTLDVHVEKIRDGALDKASNLKVIKTSGENDSPKWAYLTPLYKENYHFEGWKAGDTFVYNGMPIDPEYKEAVPVWSELVHVDAKEGNCVIVGNIEYWECSVCGKYFTDSYARTEVDDVLLPAEGHQFPLTYVEYKAAACLEAGNKAHYKCERCHKTFSDASGTTEISNVVIPALGHSYGDWYTVTEATCTEAGLKRRDCERCDYFETEVIPALGHEWVKVDKKEPTCTQDGNISYYYCDNHDNEFTVDDNHTVYKTLDEIKIPNLGHNVTHHTAKAPTCTEDGNIEHWYCANEGRYFSNAECTIKISESEAILPALGHDHTGDWVKTDAIYHWKVCRRCNAIIDKAEHFYEITYDFNASSRYLVMTSVCECGRTLSSSTTSDTGAFDISTVFGAISVTRLSDSSWSLSADSSKVKYCSWSGEDGVTLLTGPEPFSVSCQIPGAGTYKIFCHVQDRWGNEKDIYFVEFTKYR